MERMDFTRNIISETFNGVDIVREKYKEISNWLTYEREQVSKSGRDEFVAPKTPKAIKNQKNVLQDVQNSGTSRFKRAAAQIASTKLREESLIKKIRKPSNHSAKTKKNSKSRKVVSSDTKVGETSPLASNDASLFAGPPVANSTFIVNNDIGTYDSAKKSSFLFKKCSVILNKEDVENYVSLQEDTSEQNKKVAKKKVLTLKKIRKSSTSAIKRKFSGKKSKMQEVVSVTSESEISDFLEESVGLVQEEKSIEAPIKFQQNETFVVNKSIPQNVTFNLGENKVCESYDLTPCRDDRPLLLPKTKDDYGIDDLLSDDSTDTEDQPKKQIPDWALKRNRKCAIAASCLQPFETCCVFMQVPKRRVDVKMLFGNAARSYNRTSSAVWSSPIIF